MLYICIPAHNESATIGVLLWRIRKIFQSYSREYEILVFDDGSTDGTAETLAPYGDIAPLTVLRSETRKGYAFALNALAREASRRTKYPRRDAMIVMQADFTDQPESLPELIKRFEGGADIVIAERNASGEPPEVKRLRQLAPWALRFSIPVSGISDPFGSLRLYRISLIRELLKTYGEKPLVSSEGWAANVQMLIATLPLARRVEKISVDSRYNLRVRPTRIKPFADAMALFRFGRSARGSKVALPAAPVLTTPAASAPPSAVSERATS
ncbi:MAG TPA: glycosyltransferase family 2 protein [Gemmatimonadaceae bacterium]|nr:glycosyltransferase family 2 protein [Gemmatimonadaceae bacterium]